MRDLFWLSDHAWAALEPHLPHNQPGKPRVDDRRVISGILHILKTGGRWRDVPPQYGPAKTIYNRYTRWARRGVWQRIFTEIAAAGPIPEELALDSSNVKAHRSASGGKGGSSTSGRCLARWQNNEDPLSGRWLWPDRRSRADTGQHCRHQHGRAHAGSDRAGEAAHR